MLHRIPEAQNRVLLHVGIGGLLALSLIPIARFFRHAFQPLLDACQELFHCLIALRAGGAPLRWFPLLLLVGGVAYAAIDRLWIVIKLRRLLLRHEIRPPRAGEPLAVLAREFGLESRVRVLVGLAPNPAFTTGLFRPQIYIAQDLQEALTPPELRGVFRHEVCHLYRRDPLRFALLRFVSKTFFWLPLLAIWIEGLMEDAEIVADDFAAAGGHGSSDPLDVASALVKLGRSCAKTLAGTAAIGGFRLLERRILRLTGEIPARLVEFPLRRTFFSAGALLAFWALTLFPLALAGGPILTMHPGEPCHHASGAHEAHCPRCHDDAPQGASIPIRHFRS